MVRIIGHRGASASHPENTIEAFRAAADQGAHGIELDVRRSADDVLVVFHDAHLPDGRLVRNVTSAELPDQIPTLAEALAECHDLWVNIEIKNLPGDPDYDAEMGSSVAVAGLIAAYDLPHGVLVSSFDIGNLDRIRSIDPSIEAGWLVWGETQPAVLIERTVAHGLQAIHPHDLLVDRSFVQRARDAGLAVNVWTVDDPDRIRHLVELGVDGIITNDPAGAVAALR
ncbi:MAG: glycerophosphodiester phosphodiesterase [Actinomycetota bacterium]